MGSSVLGTQFCFQLAFGVLLALAFVPKAPVGAFFYRVMGTSALVPLLVAVVLPIGSGERAFGDPIGLAGLVAILAYPIFAGPVRGRRWALALGAALVGSGVALVLSLRATLGSVGQGPEGALGPFGLAVASSSALATGAVAGSVGLAMVLGHWYLTVPNLEVRHLQRLNRVSIACMLASLVLVGVSCLAFGEALNAVERPLFGPTGLVYLGTRVTVGLLMPLLFAAMAASSLRFRNTRSATGILYASTVLVLIGAAVSVSLQDAYGLPL